MNPTQDYDAAADEALKREAEATVADTHPDARTIATIVLATLAVLYTLYLAQEIVVPFVLAGVLNLLLQPAKRLLTGKLRFPNALASLLLIVALFGLVAMIATAISVPASNWIGRAPEALPQLQHKFSFLQGPLDYLHRGADQIQHLMDRSGGGQAPGGEKTVAVQQSSGLGGVGLSVLAGTKAFMGQVFTIVIVLFFLLSAGDTLLRGLVEIMPSFTEKRRVVEIGDEIEGNISSYLATITMMNLAVGIATGLATWATGLPDPLLWGTLAFLLNYIPILGPLTGVAILFAVGIFSYDTIWWAFLPAGIYLLIHVAEGETITPMLLASRLTLNPVLVILTLFFWDYMWGVIGALLAVPLLAIAKIFCDHIQALTPLGHIIGSTHKRS